MDYRHHLVIEQSIHAAHFICSFIHVDIHSMLHDYAADII